MVGHNLTILAIRPKIPCIGGLDQFRRKQLFDLLVFVGYRGGLWGVIVLKIVHSLPRRESWANTKSWSGWAAAGWATSTRHCTRG